MSTQPWLFLAFVLATTAGVVVVVTKYVGVRVAAGLLLGLAAWFGYVEGLSHFGVLARTRPGPPGMLFILAPVVGYLLAVSITAATNAGMRAVMAFPLSLVIGLQAFRVVVELFLHRLWIDGLVPQMLTYRGANVDLYVGLSAPLVALLVRRGERGSTAALAWNALGLLALANVVTRAILTAPGPLNFIHAEVPNRMFGTFPYVFIPAFFVPLAVTLHLMAIRIAWRLRTQRRVPVSDDLT